jgi:methyl-accepting chemotaxis protein
MFIINCIAPLGLVFLFFNVTTEGYTLQLSFDKLRFLLFAGSSIATALFFSYRLSKRVVEPLEIIDTALLQIIRGKRELNLIDMGLSPVFLTFNGHVQRLQTMLLDLDNMNVNKDKISLHNFDIADDHSHDYINEVYGELQTKYKELDTIRDSMHKHVTRLSNLLSSSIDQSQNILQISQSNEVVIQTVAAASEELSSSINEITRQVSHSAKVAVQASRAAEETDYRVQGLAEGASRISDVVHLIQDIANQTHLLALNATIEAARAGESGKGFGVVASEVKNLANETARATEDISEQVNNIQSATAETVQAIKFISTIINEINEIATSIASAIEEQSSATQEIAKNIIKIWKSSNNVTKVLDRYSSQSSDVVNNINVINDEMRELNTETVHLFNVIEKIDLCR